MSSRAKMMLEMAKEIVKERKSNDQLQLKSSINGKENNMSLMNNNLGEYNNIILLILILLIKVYNIFI